MSADTIVFESVSKFYGEVLGVNRIELSIEAGLTGLVGPNGSGKSTLMNLMTGLLMPDRGTIRILGIDPGDPETLFRTVGYCTQWDTFPPGATGETFLVNTLLLHGESPGRAREKASSMLRKVGLEDAERRQIAAYSKGMKQRIKLAHSLCHDPRVLVLDEPLNGLDPTGRAEIIELFTALAAEGRHVLVSSHILHEVDLIADSVVMIHGGKVVAEGAIREVREEIIDKPIQVLIRCDRARDLAARVFALEHVVQARLLDGDFSVVVATRDSANFFLDLARIVTDDQLTVESVMPADENVRAVYDYLIGNEGVPT
ncbi:MAG: ABC transporter ATP-binding protein [Thermoanaerobaculales bacterium]|nr:ABC transporter ATP-binding protein [Thermoanaerobaculales bacterium]